MLRNSKTLIVIVYGLNGENLHTVSEYKDEPLKLDLFDNSGITLERSKNAYVLLDNSKPKVFCPIDGVNGSTRIQTYEKGDVMHLFEYDFNANQYIIYEKNYRIVIYVFSVEMFNY